MSSLRERTQSPPVQTQSPPYLTTFWRRFWLMFTVYP